MKTDDNLPQKDKNGIFKQFFNLISGKNDDSQQNSKRQLFAQLLFTALVFLVLNVLTSSLVRGVISRNLSRNAGNVFSLTQTLVENDLINPKMYLSGFSRTIRTLLLNDIDKAVLEESFTDLSRHILADSRKLTGFEGLSGYFENMPGGPVFINTFEFEFPQDYEPSQRPWYKNAVAAQGEIAETIAYNDIINKQNILIYSLCIHDDDGKLLGVVCMRLKIDAIGEKIVKTTVDRGGWGMLISPDLIVLAHINKPFVGIDARDPGFPPHIYVPEMMRGESVFEGHMEDYQGSKSLTFFRPLSNGWYLGLVTPERPYYQSLTTLAYVLGILGVIFAAVLMIILIRIDMAKNKSDRESRHKSAFLANMSHEIRTPMNAIIGMTTIGKSAETIERMLYCFGKIEDASNHLLGVINDILDMSKIEANKFELVNEEFNFEKMLQRVVNVVNFRVDEKHHTFTVHIDKDIPRFVIGDDQRIAQVITNLLGNAIKFTPEKGSITLNAKLLGEENDYYNIQFSVIDTGIGLNEEQKNRIFFSFEQAEKSTTRKYGGTGLGLAISKNIVELMGGNIIVESEPNKGSAFTFNIHVKNSSRVHEGLLDSDVNLSNVRIMAVDDDQDILNYFNEIAEGFGVACCDTALSGEEALGLVVRNGDYHIYFVDWKMPVMDGIQLASEIKKRTSAKSVVIMITAAEWTTIEVQAKKAGVDKFLSKPLFPSAIMDVIKECISLDRQQMEAAHTHIKGIFAERTILLAEDVEINREIVQALLEPTNIKIEYAENGLEAVQMFQQTPDKYDMILMDVQMPVMDGYEATKQIRALDIPKAKTVRIIAMTANVFRDDIERCQEVGMDSHIGKPINFDEVVEKLINYMPNPTT
jgi:signal transduction histidine kinase/DNA-binding response OmpR family regulator